MSCFASTPEIADNRPRTNFQRSSFGCPPGVVAPRTSWKFRQPIADENAASSASLGNRSVNVASSPARGFCIGRLVIDGRILSSASSARVSSTPAFRAAPNAQSMPA